MTEIKISKRIKGRFLSAKAVEIMGAMSGFVAGEAIHDSGPMFKVCCQFSRLTLEDQAVLSKSGWVIR